MNQDANDSGEPIHVCRIGNSDATLLGTAHVSRTSAETVREMLHSGRFDAVAVELCPSRHNAIIDPDSLARMDLFQVLRKGKAGMVMASLALGAFQQRLADQFGIEPGAEMRAAVDYARTEHLPVLLIDREIGTTLKRVYHNMPWWRRFTLIGGLAGSLFARDEEISEAEIERLKEGDVLESAFSEFAMEAKDLYEPLIDERDRYMAARLQQEAEAGDHKHILAVVGAGHLAGIQRYLEQPPLAPEPVIEQLDQVPRGARWPRLIPWAILILVLVGFAVGFSRSPEIGWELVGVWVLINGGFAALGALLARAHPLSIITAFVAAPITSLNPAVGAGMVTAGAELLLRKPAVGDFSQLRHDTAHLGGWWKNRVARTLLVFAFSTLGSAIGTYVAGFRIFDRLLGG